MQTADFAPPPLTRSNDPAAQNLPGLCDLPHGTNDFTGSLRGALSSNYINQENNKSKIDKKKLVRKFAQTKGLAKRVTAKSVADFFGS